jgi:5S rRNA maturation endonuclease (ribonuclease M5)
MNLKQIKSFLNNHAEEVFNKLGMNYENFGDNIYSTCPVHESSDNPRAFSFCKQRGIWKCWTRECQNEYKNDIFGLIMGSLSNQNGSQASFGEVLSWVKDNFNIRTSINDEQKIEIEHSEFDQLIHNLKDDITFPKLNLVELKIKLETPSPYFINRGFLKKTLEYFEVGDCFDKSSKLYERSIIPIHDDAGNNKIAYICRSTKEYKSPKFLIYPKGFDKRFCFYNMHRALHHIKNQNSVFIVEGQGDVWKLHEAGVYNVVGMFGKTLTKEQQKKLQKLPLTHVVILTDNDQAGRESKIQLQRQLGRFYRLTFPQLSHKDVGDMSIKQIKQDILSQIRG